MRHVIFILTFSLLVTVALALMLFWPSVDQSADKPTAATSSPATQSVALFYYQPEADMDDQGNIQCSPAGLVGVFRDIPETVTPLEDTLHLFMEGDLTPREQQMGIITEFPLQGVSLVGINLVDGVATIALDDPQFQTGGGSCRARVLRAQMTRTTLQFPTVEEVRFIPETLFQP